VACISGGPGPKLQMATFTKNKRDKFSTNVEYLPATYMTFALMLILLGGHGKSSA
jgi:hypothetical protein